ncbi:MAG: GlmU family protein [Flavobacteriales bacterium]|jgi:UDP-N-acetylglucosamine diphosphorylase/glucosamine-1-phosphate N-acetyltransferase|nr:GlmU family protein [Flavobacteriales bacterium]
MNTIVFFENSQYRTQLKPFTFTRPLSHIRVGILTIAEKWQKRTNFEIKYLNHSSLQEKFGEFENNNEEVIFVNSSVCPSSDLIDLMKRTTINQAYFWQEDLLFYKGNLEDFKDKNWEKHDLMVEPVMLRFHFDIFSKNGVEIQRDFDLLTQGRNSQAISPTNTCIAPENIFLEEGAKVECAVLNASSGPIYIGKNAEIMEGSVVRGALAMGENAVLKLSTKIYGATTVGPFAKVGGEVNNSVIFGYSNKGHDGFLGNSVLGEWCNLGADTNNSNLKNNYSQVRVWNYQAEEYQDSGLQFCGLIMGDHSKCGINTMFNTGTVVGVSANVFGGGFPPKFIPSFTWGGADGFVEYRLDKALEVAQRVMERRKVDLNEADRKLLENILLETKKYR